MRFYAIMSHVRKSNPTKSNQKKLADPPKKNSRPLTHKGQPNSLQSRKINIKTIITDDEILPHPPIIHLFLWIN